MSETTSLVGMLSNIENFAADGPGGGTTMPRLRFGDGDLVIKLANDPKAWLIIHSKVFAAVSPVFKASSSDSWKDQAQLDRITHPDTGEDVLVRTLALKLAENTYILEGKEVLLQAADSPPARATPFYKSSLATEGWPDLAEGGYDYESADNDDAVESARALQVFFALVYGAKLRWEEIAGHKHITRRLLEVCAYAEFWGCFEHVAPLVTWAIRGQKKNLHRMVAFKPKEYAMLAKKLRQEDIYNDAIRHLVAQAFVKDKETNPLRLINPQQHPGGDWATIAEIMELDEDEVLNIFPWQLEWIYDPDAVKPSDPAKLEGKGWYEWAMPAEARYTIPYQVLAGLRLPTKKLRHRTHLAVPVQKLPWEGEMSNWVEDEAGLRDIAYEISTEDASDEWIETLAEHLGGD